MVYIISILKLSSVCLSLCLSVSLLPWTHPYISAKYKDNDTKLSGYDHGGLSRTFMMSRMTLSSKDRGFLTQF